MCRWPEGDRAQGIKAKAHEDGELVALALEDFGGNGRKAEVTTAKVHDLETGGFELGDSERVLEMLVEDTGYVSCESYLMGYSRMLTREGRRRTPRGRTGK